LGNSTDKVVVIAVSFVTNGLPTRGRHNARVRVKLTARPCAEFHCRAHDARRHVTDLGGLWRDGQSGQQKPKTPPDL